MRQKSCGCKQCGHCGIRVGVHSNQSVLMWGSAPSRSVFGTQSLTSAYAPAHARTGFDAHVDPSRCLRRRMSTGSDTSKRLRSGVTHDFRQLGPHIDDHLDVAEHAFTERDLRLQKRGQIGL